MMEPAGASEPAPRAFLRVGGATLARHQLGIDQLRAAYRERAAAEPSRFRVIDATQSPAKVLADAIDAVAELTRSNA